MIADEETVLGFGLVGVEGYAVRSGEESEAVFDKLLQREDLGIILVGTEAAEPLREKMEQQLARGGFPLVAEIPGRNGYAEGHSDLKERVYQAVGIHF